jgi:hypothetical protein
MGGGRWSTDVYSEQEKLRKQNGKSAFDYDDKVKRSGHLKPHATLDPFGIHMREAHDSPEHPDSNAIVVMLDVTGSMSTIPKLLQQDLPQLLGLLLYKNYIPHPQILFGAIGDAHSDKVPLQVGQFESDNRMDQHLQNLVLEGNGGGQGMESYDLAFYFMARHTAIDCYDQHGRKGYMFVIGDEMAYPQVEKKFVQQIIGAGIEVNIPLKQIVDEVMAKYNLFFIIPTGASGGKDSRVSDFWKKTIGEQRVLQLQDPGDIAELITLVIGMNEGTIGMDDGIADLRQHGANDKTIVAVKNAVSVLPMATSPIIKGSGSIKNLLGENKPRTKRL